MRNSREPARVTEPRSLGQFMELGADCHLLRPMPLFIAIHEASQGMPCNGCAYGDHEDCQGKKKLYQPQRAVLVQPQGETVREQAARLGVSISEIRRRRRTA